MPQKQIKTKFNSGELSPLLDGGTDLSKFYNGCSKLVNGTVLPYGGIVKRSGSEFIAVAKSKCRLLEFEFSAVDTMIIEMGNLYARFYQNDERILEVSQTVTAATQADPVVITVVGHGYSTGDWVVMTIDGMTEINGKTYQITLDAGTPLDKFSLQDFQGVDIDGTGFGAFTAGSVQKVYEIATVYDSDEVFDIHYTQSADVIYMAHDLFPPQKLSRVSVDVSTLAQTWTIADVDFAGGPFLSQNVDTTDTMTFTRTGGTIAANGYFPAGAIGTLAASVSDPFLGTSDDIGTKWLLQTTRIDNTATETTATTSDEIPTKGDYTLSTDGYAAGQVVTLERKEGAGDWQDFRSFTASTAFSGTELFDDVLFRFTIGAPATDHVTIFTAKDQINLGVVEVTAEINTGSATVIVLDKVQQEGATAASVPTSIWSEGAWGEFRGYPKSVTFFEDRLWWASTTNNPQTLWGSVIREYEDQTPGTLDDDAVNFTIQDNNMSSIQWIAARKTLVTGTANKEYSVRANNIDNPITPSDVKVSSRSTHGSDGIQPVTLNEALFYVQRSGRKVWRMTFNFADENYDSIDATLLAEHLLETSPVSMAAQGVPDAILWVVRDDGVLLSFTYKPEEEVSAWARHVTGDMSTPILNDKAEPTDMFESVAVIAGSVEDEVWFSVDRGVQQYEDGENIRYIEKFSTRFFDQLDEAQMLDSAVVQLSTGESAGLIIASDTVRFGSGEFGSSSFGGTV